MRTIKLLCIVGLFVFARNVSGQYLPESYQPMFNEIVTNFETITSGNSINDGSTSLRVINDDRIILRVKHKKQVKNLTFETKLDEESKKIWVAGNPLTIDMVNKYEDYLTKTLEDMYALSDKKSKE